MTIKNLHERPIVAGGFNAISESIAYAMCDSWSVNGRCSGACMMSEEILRSIKTSPEALRALADKTIWLAEIYKDAGHIQRSETMKISAKGFYDLADKLEAIRGGTKVTR